MQRFDALPLEYKRVLWSAPENYQVGWVYRLIARDPATALPSVRRKIEAETRKTIRTCWPPGHPQALD